MNKLPAEILSRIFILLPIEDKVEYMTVCKKWVHVIKSFCLLDTVRITSVAQLNFVTEKIRSEPLQAKQVERLLLNFDSESSFDLTGFINQFPNLRVIYMENSKSTQFQTLAAPFNNKNIECIFDQKGLEMSTYFLRSNQCTHLKHLTIDDSWHYNNTLTSFISLFPYLPLLESLTLNNIIITFDEFETLHTMLPSLKSLAISRLFATDSALPASIEPATSIIQLNIFMEQISLSLQTKYCQYASKKYTNLLWLDYGHFYVTDEPQENINLFYKNGVVPFIQPLASQLKQCQLDLTESPKDVTDLVDQINFNQKHFELLLDNEEIISKITKVIQSNRIEGLVKLVLTYSTFSPDFKILKELTALKEMAIFKDPDDHKTDGILIFNDALKVCADSVETLRLRNMTLKLDISDTCQYNIKNLDLSSVCLDRGIDTFITRYIRSLNMLRLSTVRFSENKLFLSDLNLSHLEISDPTYLEHNAWVDKNHLNVLISTLNNNARRMYSSNGFTSLFNIKRCFRLSDWSVYPQVKSISFNETNIYPDLTFELASVNKVVISCSYYPTRRRHENKEF